MGAKGGHVKHGAAQIEARRRIGLESFAHAVLDPLAEFFAALYQIGEIRTVPGRQVALERARIVAREAPARAVTAGAAERIGASESSGSGSPALARTKATRSSI